MSDTGGDGKRMGRELFFATPIYHADLADAAALNAELRRHIERWRETDPAGDFRSNEPNLGGWHSPTDMHTRHEFDPLTREILELMHGVFTTLGYDGAYEPVCDSMWANVNPRHAANRHHTHPHALWSGVYYVHTPPDCGLLWFSDPRAQAQVLTPHYDLAKRAPLTWSEIHYQPIEGRIIAFPAWLTHAVQPNLTTEAGPAGDRISISFNIRQRRRDAGPTPPNEVVAADVAPGAG